MYTSNVEYILDEIHYLCDLIKRCQSRVAELEDELGKIVSPKN